MRLRGPLISSLALALGACASAGAVKVPEVPLSDHNPVVPTINQPEPRTPITVVEVPKPLPLPGQLKPVATTAKVKDQTPPKERIAHANTAARIEPAQDGYINAMHVYPFAPGALYQVYAAPHQVTDIALEPSEKLVAVSAGDTLRWVVGDTTSGEGAGTQVHILVKPIGANLETNLVITTERRTYHLELKSTDKAYMASVSWTYARDRLLALKGQQASNDAGTGPMVESGIKLDRMRFRYRIEGDAPWKPRQVFDDGAKVYIQFPSGLAQSEAPPLFVIGPDGKPALVNYRVRGTTYIVDRLFAAAELRLGTAPQRIVRILRTDAQWREVGP